MTPRAMAWARLVRAPNVMTPLADIGLGVLVAGPREFGLFPAVLLALSSASLYSAGMVWNDVFDIDQDRRERPSRPLPSGEISPASARRLGVLLLVLGVFLAVFAGAMARPRTILPAVIAASLVAAILLYDAWLKRTWLGPISMGTCRFLNVLLGLSAVGPELVSWPIRIHLAGIVGVYVIGLTWLARAETRRSDPDQLRAASAVMAFAIVLALAWPLWWPAGTASALYVYLLAAFAVAIGIPVARAWSTPTAKSVQGAVKRAILGLVALDAVLATAAVGTGGLALLLLLPPAVVLGRRVYST